MKLKEIRELLKARPFRPFRVHISDGASYEIRHPELCLPGRETMFIGFPSPEDADKSYYERFCLVLHFLKKT